MPDQALVWEDPTDRPGTHVLLIGIGDYPWLTCGTSFDAEQHGEAAMGMKQLSAPPVSMRKLADWFLDPADRSGFDNPARQLASISLVLSEATPASYSHPRLAAPVGSHSSRR